MNDRIQRHYAFWNREETDRPLVGFIIGPTFPMGRYRGKEILHKETGMEINPEDIKPEDFLTVYEDLWKVNQETEQDAFWTADPFPAVPWMEAFSGCRIYMSDDSMWSTPLLTDWSQFDIQGVLGNRDWISKYLEFLAALEKLSQGRFPVGQPILRGPIDMMGALRGQTSLIMDMVDDSQNVPHLSSKVVDLTLEIWRKQYEVVKPFNSGYSMGFYNLWCPGPCAWFQEDLTSLISPVLYEQYLLNIDKVLSSAYAYSMIHLHPTSFFILDHLLAIPKLGVIQINKDTGGPSILEMMPIFKKVLERKRLMIWGELDEDDIELIMKSLNYKGLFLNIMVPDSSVADKMMQLIKKMARKN